MRLVVLAALAASLARAAVATWGIISDALQDVGASDKFKSFVFSMLIICSVFFFLLIGLFLKRTREAMRRAGAMRAALRKKQESGREFRR